MALAESHAPGRLLFIASGVELGCISSWGDTFWGDVLWTICGGQSGGFVV